MILIDGTITLHVMDVIRFDEVGMIRAIRAYLGKGDEQALRRIIRRAQKFGIIAAPRPATSPSVCNPSEQIP
ncbi:MAG: hypothetical protein ABI790_06585 [Betaproteobacteria bacterium]